MWSELQDLPKREEALLHTFGFGRQAKVLQDDHRLVPTQFGNGGMTILGREDVIALKTPFELAQESWVILDDQ